MAKTLIGNIKGKDGRGVASISKTGTTGSVDTYTIKYTDGTSSTYTVNNSDSVLLQRQIVPSAAVESSATASQAYAKGDYVVVSGVLRKVTAAISKGSAISGSNSTATTVTGELAASADSVDRKVINSGDFSIQAHGWVTKTYSLSGYDKPPTVLLSSLNWCTVNVKDVSAKSLTVEAVGTGTDATNAHYTLVLVR